MDLIQDLLDTDSNKLNEISDKIYDINRNNLDYWNFMILNTTLDNDTINNNFDFLDKNLLVKNQKLKKEILLKDGFIDYNDTSFINLIITCQNLDMDTLEEIIKLNKDVDWYLISKFQNLTIFFIDKYKDKLNWEIVSELQYLPLEYIQMEKERICFKSLGKNIQIQSFLNDDFLEKFKDEDIWECMIWSENISNECLIKYLDKLDEKQILDLLEVKKLNMDTIKIILEKYHYIENLYDYLSEGQVLDEDFIDENLDKFSINLLVINQNLSFEFLYKIRDKFELSDISLNDNLSELMLEEILECKNEFQGELDWEFILENINLSMTFKNKIRSLI